MLKVSEINASKLTIPIPNGWGNLVFKQFIVATLSSSARRNKELIINYDHPRHHHAMLPAIHSICVRPGKPLQVSWQGNHCETGYGTENEIIYIPHRACSFSAS